MAMKRTRVGLRTVAGIAMLAQIGCSDSPTASTDRAVAPRLNTTLQSSGVLSDGRVSVDAALSLDASATSVQSDASTTIIIGAPSEAPNIFPFGGGFGLSTRYQQAYAANQFNGAAPLLIRSISFLGGQGILGASTYTFSLSTITTGIDNLSTTNFNANRGADNALLASVNLSGPAPATLTIEGATPFLYDPSSGNLLLDIVVSPGVAQFAQGASYQSRLNAFGIMSRYHNFGGGFIGFGLITQFEFAPLTLG
jgi:hypothetical protein